MFSYLFRTFLTISRRPFLLALAMSIGTIIGATFARQLLNVLNSCMKGQGAKICFWLLTSLLTISLGRKAVRENFSSLCIALAVIVFSFQLRQIEERIHLLQYGMIGFLWANAFTCYNKTQWLLWSSISGCIAGLATACLDELIQAILPYRVGDFRDIGFDFVGSIAGVSICLLRQKGLIEKTRTISAQAPMEPVK